MNQQTTDGEAIDEKSNGDVAARCEPAANHNLNANTNTNIIIRPYAEYFVRKEGKTGFFRMIRKNWHQMSILWPGKSNWNWMHAHSIRFSADKATHDSMWSRRSDYSCEACPNETSFSEFAQVYCYYAAAHKCTFSGPFGNWFGISTSIMR